MRTEPAKTPAPQISATPSNAPEPAPGKIPDASPSPESSLVKQLPLPDQIREQAINDPHAPPPAGAAFALQLADQLEIAVKSEAASIQFLRELDACAANSKPGTIVPSVQALCLQAARELATKHPSLMKEVEEVFDRAEPETAALARSLED